jgi:hypothetical protein
MKRELTICDVCHKECGVDDYAVLQPIWIPMSHLHTILGSDRIHVHLKCFSRMYQRKEAT